VATGAGDGSIIATLVEPVTPSLTALITAVPGATPAIVPALSTVAIVVLELFQVTGRSDNGVPLASIGVAVPFTLCPTRRAGDGRLMATDATGVLSTGMTDVSPDEHAMTPNEMPVTARNKVRIKMRPPRKCESAARPA
jgi:hypothetical protein